MARLLLRRLAHSLGVVFAATTLTFALVHLAPGDPTRAAMSNGAVPTAVRERWRTLHGLDRPLPEQYVRYVAGVARGELGYSFSLRRPVADVLADALPNTLVLMGASIVRSDLPGAIVDPAGLYIAYDVAYQMERITVRAQLSYGARDGAAHAGGGLGTSVAF